MGVCRAVPRSRSCNLDSRVDKSCFVLMNRMPAAAKSVAACVTLPAKLWPLGFSGARSRRSNQSIRPRDSPAEVPTPGALDSELH